MYIAVTKDCKQRGSFVCFPRWTGDSRKINLNTNWEAADSMVISTPCLSGKERACVKNLPAKKCGKHLLDIFPGKPSRIREFQEQLTTQHSVSRNKTMDVRFLWPWEIDQVVHSLMGTLATKLCLPPRTFTYTGQNSDVLSPKQIG